MKINEILLETTQNMKINEILLETIQYNAKTGHYSADYNDKKQISKQFLDKLGATKEDVAEAIKQVKASDIFAQALKLMDAKYSPGSEKNGTLVFNKPILPTGSGRDTYHIYVTGQIRSQGARGELLARLKSPKMRLVIGNPVKSLVKTYTQAIEELIKKAKVRVRKASDADAKAGQALDDLHSGKALLRSRKTGQVMAHQQRTKPVKHPFTGKDLSDQDY